MFFSGSSDKLILLLFSNNQFRQAVVDETGIKMDNHSVKAPFLERRLKPRMKCNYPAKIQGREGNGKKFEETGRVVNMSRNGIFVLMNRAISDSYQVSVQIALPTGILEYGSSKLITTGTVVRTEPCPDGTFGVAIKFQNVRYL